MGILEVTLQDKFNYLVKNCIPRRCYLLQKGYYLNFRVGKNTYYKAIWFDYNGKNEDKIIIYMPDHRYRNVYLSKVKGVSVCFFDGFYNPTAVLDDEGFIGLHQPTYRVQIDYLFELIFYSSISYDNFREDRILLEYLYNGRRFGFLIAANDEFDFNLIDDLKNCYLTLNAVYCAIKLHFDSKNQLIKTLREKLPISNKINLVKPKLKF